jgi:hypothetical protein
MTDTHDGYTADILHRQFLQEAPPESRQYSAFSDFEFLSGTIHIMLSLMERYERRIEELENEIVNNMDVP